jgi:hypothetical protein
MLYPSPSLELLLSSELESLEQGEESELESLEGEESELELLEGEESELESLEGPEGEHLPLWLDFPEREHPFFPTL